MMAVVFVLEFLAALLAVMSGILKERVGHLTPDLATDVQSCEVRFVNILALSTCILWVFRQPVLWQLSDQIRQCREKRVKLELH